jgi:hypothetical protein
VEARQEDVPYRHVAAITVLFFIATTTTACVVTDLGIVFQFIGGIAGSLLIFVLPGALVVADNRPVTAPEAAILSGMQTGVIAHNDMHVPILQGNDGAERSNGKQRRWWSSRRRGRTTCEASSSTALAGREWGTVGLETPCYESAWDRPWLGWVLIVIGVCMIVLTLYTALVPLSASSGGYAGEATFTSPDPQATR